MKAPNSHTLFELLVEKAAIDPAHDAVILAGARVSYAELAGRARRVAGFLRGKGVKGGDRIGLIANNRIEWLDVFFGAAALGCVVVPFSTWSTAGELRFLVEDSGVSLVFSIERFGERGLAADLRGLSAAGGLSGLREVIAIDGPAAAATAGYGPAKSSEPIGVLAPGEGADGSDVLVILYTSGSSNRPKAVPLEHRAAIENGFNIGERQGLCAADKVLISIPLFWSYGAVNALVAVLTHGATMVLQSHFEAGSALDLIEQEQCTALYTLPAMTNALIAHPAFRAERTASLRTGVTIGAPQDIIKAAEQLGARSICNIYGQTESYGNCCVTPHDWPLERRAHCQGPPLPGVVVRIRDVETGVLVAPGEVGAIEVSGYLTPGYRGASARFNAETFTADGFFRTGDLGAIDETGALRFEGRSSEVIKRSGINVSPSEVEEILQRHPAIGLAGVTGSADAARGEIIVAFVTAATAGGAVSEADVMAHCREHLSRYKVPDRLLVVAALPLTVTGKVMRRELKEMARRAETGEK